MRFVYSVIRYVPDPVRGEFVNIGAIAGSEESSEWEVRQVENPVRAGRLDERGSLPAAWSFIDQIVRDVDAFADAIEQPRLDEPDVELSEAWLDDLSRRHRNVVQLTPPAPIAADSASDALDRVFTQLIVDPARRPGGGGKHPVLATVRRAYREAGLRKNLNLFERVVLEVGVHRERVDFAVTNGRVVQLTQAWSFQVAHQDALAEHIRAWGWTMKAAREAGGSSIEVGERQRYAVAPDVSLAVVFAPPEEGQAAPAFEDAQGVFQALDAEAFEIGRAEGLTNVASGLLNGFRQG